jgi:hypothetical protein
LGLCRSFLFEPESRSLSCLPRVSCISEAPDKVWTTLIEGPAFLTDAGRRCSSLALLDLSANCFMIIALVVYVEN